MVTVDNAGNAADTHFGGYFLGSVEYDYQIGKYEITAGEYTEFLNAVARDDPNGLYNIAMREPIGSVHGESGANIQRNGESGNYSYEIDSDWANRPVNWVSFWDAARFVNWLHNGQPTGPQGPGTTEDGAYHDVGNQALFGRSAEAKFFIPTADEWYKAAYHDRASGLAASYFIYPTGTNLLPGNDITESTNPGNNANYYVSDFAIGIPYYRTIVGEFELSASPYGTFDQGGNVLEWNETKYTNDFRGLTGGQFYNSDPLLLRASPYSVADPSIEADTAGFRIASITIPEPPGFMIFANGLTIICGLRHSGGPLMRKRRPKSLG